MNNLKSVLGLQNYPYVYYARLIGSPLKIYFVFFDSRRPAMPLTSTECHRKEFASVVPYRHDERMKLTNIIPIDDFSGDISNSYFIRVDLAGRFQQQAMYEKTYNILVEDMNLTDFKSAAAVSDRIRKARKNRKALLGGGNEIKHVKLVGCHVDERNDFVQFEFLSQVTPDGKKKYRVDPSNGFKPVPNLSGIYHISLRLCDYAKWLFDTMPDGHTLTPKDLKDALEVCPIKIWDDDPSLYWQGFAYNLTQLDACIYEVNIPPKHWNKVHGGDFFLSKHMTALIMNIEFFMNNMNSMLTKRLKDLGILDVGYTFHKHR